MHYALICLGSPFASGIAAAFAGTMLVVCAVVAGRFGFALPAMMPSQLGLAVVVSVIAVIAFATASGRLFLGIETATASRYAT